MKRRNKLADKKYAKYVLSTPISQIPHDGYNFEGIYAHQEGLGGANCTLSFQYITVPFEEGPPHKHNGHQLLVFVGSNLENMSDFDADVEIALGDELEIQNISTPSVVSIPPGLTHCPLRFTRVSKPVLFIEIVLEGSYKRVLEPGEEEFEVYTKLL